MRASRGMGIINPKKLKNCGCSHSKPKKMKAGRKKTTRKKA